MPFPWTEIKANVPLGSGPGSQTPLSRSLTLQGSQRNALDSNREWVLVKTYKEQSLTPQWEGPFQVLLTTEAAIRTKERGWIHASRIKGPVEEPKEWMITAKQSDTKLTLKWGLGGNELGRPK
ncbi:hypothetical protein DUI87_26285 [Hirundo rustica rustica]|uniref:Murine leukemia virus integrase C-terminal domain-containing protein n=1 Tax=Hirundo rustica rustica TaxID=333673 RepID=A0A3M0J8H5_HIRRU|nr:hypothetical protein DUI87_26285 [Hirundo rustica rustica]